MTSWALEGFLDRLDAWIELEHPGDDLKIFVTAWTLSRHDNPYAGVRREPGFDNLWFGVVPGSVHGTCKAVTCAYWIFESRHTVRCDSFATLSLPIR